MSERLDLAIDAYRDGTLAADDARLLVAALRGEEASVVRERLAFTNLLAQAFTSDDAVIRSVAERIDAERSASTVVRAVQRSIGNSRRSRRQSSPILSWAAVAALLAVMISVGWWMNASQRPVAVECRLEIPGEVQLERSGRRIATVPGMALIAGDRVAVMLPATLSWSDGSRIVIAPGSQVVISRPGIGPGLRLDAGAIEAEIHSQHSGAPFAISTPAARIEVLGTQFHLQSDVHRTTCDLHQGVVRLIRLSDDQRLNLAAGQSATVAEGVAFIAKNREVSPPTPAKTVDAAWTPLFSQADLADWQQQHGTWSNIDGLVRGHDPQQKGKARILSTRTFGDVELTCRLRMTGVPFAEVQVGNYNWFVEVPAGRDWVHVALLQRGADLHVTADGVALALHPGDGAAMRSGPLAFYVMPGGTLEITEARFRTPSSP